MMKTLLVVAALLAVASSQEAAEGERQTHYYYNSVTQKSQWEVPDEYGHISTDPEHKGARFWVVNGISTWEKPKEWDFEEHTDKETGAKYYHNRHSGVSVWEKPACMAWDRYENSGGGDL